jgi:Na+/melibiose symporter-like transporter
MIHSLLPVFLVSVLGVSALSVGFIEGIAEAMASVSKVFSGVISDWDGRRKPSVLLGHGLAAVTKPLFPLASNISMVKVCTWSPNSHPRSTPSLPKHRKRDRSCATSPW